MQRLTPETLDSLQEHCGVLGIIEKEGIDLLSFLLAFKSLQRRGQGGWGVLASQLTPSDAESVDQKFIGKKGKGPIQAMSTDSEVQGIFARKPSIVVAQNRYPTTGKEEPDTDFNTQPFWTQNLGVGHNGNNQGYLRLMSKTQLRVDGDSDTAYMVSYMDQELPKYGSVEEMLLHILPEFDRSYSLVINPGDRLIAVRDGNRPLCFGRTAKGGWIVASESTSIVHSGGTYIRELNPHEMITFYPDGTCRPVLYAAQPGVGTFCSFEIFYFSGNESYDGQHFMKDLRKRLGAGLADRLAKKGILFKCLIPILKSGEYAGKGAAEKLHVPIPDVLTLRDQDAMRSFIEKDADARTAVIRNKFGLDNLVEIAGASIVIVDDTIVRSRTTEEIVSFLRAKKEESPGEIHVAIATLPVIQTCTLGVNISTFEELMVGKLLDRWPDLDIHNIDQIEERAAEYLNVDSVTFATAEIVTAAVGKNQDQMCMSCFGGPHPVHDRQPPTFLAHHFDDLQQEPPILYISSAEHTPQQPPPYPVHLPHRSHKVLLPELKQTGLAEMGAEIELDESIYLKGIEVLLRQAERFPPVVVLAGWREFLSLTGLKTILHHIQELSPSSKVFLVEHALIEAHGEETQTSLGRIPQLRGKKQLQQAFDQSQAGDLSVTGVTLFEVKLKKNHLTAEVLMRQEVGIRVHEGLPVLQERMYRAEEQVVSVAVQQALLDKVARQQSQPELSHSK